MNSALSIKSVDVRKWIKSRKTEDGKYKTKIDRKTENTRLETEDACPR